MRLVSVALILAAAALCGCSSLLGIEDLRLGDDDTTIDGGIDAADPPPVAARYVISHVDVPVTASESNTWGRDLDGDGSIDNQLGSIFAALASSDIVVAFQANDAITRGDAIWLHAVAAYDLTGSDPAIWLSYDGEPEATPDYTGNGVFSVDTTAPVDRQVVGAIVDDQIVGEAGTARAVLGMGSGVLHLDLRAAEVAVSVTADTCTGVIAGGISQEDVQGRFVPGMATAIQQVLADDPACPPANGSLAETLLSLFDENNDCTVTVAEIAMNGLIMSLTAPDLDLLDAAGAPGTDGVNESLSMGVGITCARASFASP